jgi:hypothetical protein
VSRAGTTTINLGRYAASIPHLPTAACTSYPLLPWAEEDDRIPKADLQIMRGLCIGCPERRPCLTHAMRSPEVGVWGGLTKHDRENWGVAR